MTYVEEFKSLLAKQGAKGVADKILSNAKIGLHVEKQFKTESVSQKPFLGFIPRKAKQVRCGLQTQVGASRMGGVPDLPPGVEWPTPEGKPAGFLMQVNCADIAAYASQTLLPTEGILHFFYDYHDSQLWHDASPKETGLVQFCPMIGDLRPATVPSGRKTSELVYPAFPIKFVPIPTFPDGLTPEFEALGLSETEAEAFSEAQIAWNIQCLHSHTPEWGGLHQMGGHASCVQGDVRVELEMEANGNYASSDRKLWDQASRNAHNWRLLLQFDTDDDLGAMWGDAGRLYYGILEDDLKARRFGKARVVMQCG